MNAYIFSEVKLRFKGTLVDTGLMFLLNSRVGGFSWVAAAFHVWVLYYLFTGVGAGFRLHRILGMTATKHR